MLEKENIRNLLWGKIPYSDIQRSLCHHRDPWVREHQIRYAVAKWRIKDDPRDWPPSSYSSGRKSRFPHASSKAKGPVYSPVTAFQPNCSTSLQPGSTQLGVMPSIANQYMAGDVDTGSLSYSTIDGRTNLLQDDTSDTRSFYPTVFNNMDLEGPPLALGNRGNSSYLPSTFNAIQEPDLGRNAVISTPNQQTTSFNGFPYNNHDRDDDARS